MPGFHIDFSNWLSQQFKLSSKPANYSKLSNCFTEVARSGTGPQAPARPTQENHLAAFWPPTLNSI